jgi:hypothetical protein
MQQLTIEYLTSFLSDQVAPCVSLYMPTHRSYPDNQKDPLVYKGLVKEMEASLQGKYPQGQISQLVDRFRALQDDRDFWNCRSDSLAVLASSDMFQTFDLQRPVPQLVVVADSFHIKPLLRILQSADRFQILCLNRDEVKLFEGNRDALTQIELEGVPTSLTEALGEELTEPQLRVSSYGMRGSGSTDKAMYHGQGSRKEEIRNDMLRFFRVVDRAVLANYSRPSALPLLLAALPEHHAEFRSVSHNSFLMKDGLMFDASSMSTDELRLHAWKKIEPIYLERLRKLVERCQSAKAQSQGSDELAEVVPAALDGRIESLLIEAGRQIPGKIDAEARAMQAGEITDPDTDDVLDDLAEIVLRTSGEVVIVPSERMPSKTGLAAIYRF